MCQACRGLVLKSVPDRKTGSFYHKEGEKASELLSYIVMTKYLRISILVKPQLLSAKPQHFSTPLSLNPTICPAIPGDFFVIVFLWDEAAGEVRAVALPARRLAGGACCM